MEGHFPQERSWEKEGEKGGWLPRLGVGWTPGLFVCVSSPGIAPFRTVRRDSESKITKRKDPDCFRLLQGTMRRSGEEKGR